MRYFYVHKYIRRCSLDDYRADRNPFPAHDQCINISEVHGIYQYSVQNPIAGK